MPASVNKIVHRWLPSDLETPVSAYLKLSQGEKYSFLLESIEGGESLGRYSVIGLAPDLIISVSGKTATTIHTSTGESAQSDSPLEAIRAQLAASAISLPAKDDLPPMAASGLFGYLGYDMVRLIEDIPDTNPSDTNIPDGTLIRPQVLVIFDHVKNKMCLIAPVYVETDSDDEARKRLTDIEKKLGAPLPADTISASSTLTSVDPQSNMSEAEYCAAVDKAIAYINKGDIFQVVPGQRFSAPFDLPPVALYRSLRRLNPSPFMFLLAFNDFALVGSSPEILVRVRDNTVTIRPIAGTRPRGQTTEEDLALEQELLADPKERAEHLMLLDLGRNDIGRVAKFGSVKVTEQFIIERYSHVMHIVSNVEGQLRDDMDSIDALFAGFPAGTVSGAPKVRAMEIIDELEITRRGYYGGCAGYLSGHGDMDTCIALRTALIKDGIMIVQAGGGVVADSKPKAEYQESVNKAKALFRAAEDAIRGSQA